jgi:hypothetical protein
LVFGLVMLWEIGRFYFQDHLEYVWIRPRLHFKYYGFAWIQAWPELLMYAHFIGLAVLALCITLGVAYRATMALFFIGFTYIFLLEQAAYQNHYYLICLLSFLMIFMPAHRAASVDAWRGWVRRSGTTPAWTLWLLRFQLAVVYFYGGLAKINADWLRGEPMRLWLARRSDYTVIGPYVHEEWLTSFFTYGGLVFDLSIVPLLLWRRTRPFAFVLALSFHLLNNWIFKIGIFPAFMIFATALFFAPAWPRRLLRLVGLGGHEPPGTPVPAPPSGGRQRLALALLGLYAAFQLLFPLRHHFYPGPASWNEEGHYFAWRMMLRNKDIASQSFMMRETASGSTTPVVLRNYFDRWQAESMLESPGMILQFCHYLAEEQRRAGAPTVSIYASVYVSLNGRPAQLLVDPAVDLASQPRSLGPATWIMPLQHPLQR